MKGAILVVGIYLISFMANASEVMKGDPAIARNPAQASAEWSPYAKMTSGKSSDWGGFKQIWVSYDVTAAKSDAIELEARCATKEQVVISGGCLVLSSGDTAPLFLGSYAYRSSDANGTSYSYWKCKYSKIAPGQTIMAQAICK